MMPGVGLAGVNPRGSLGQSKNLGTVLSIGVPRVVTVDLVGGIGEWH